MQLPQSWVIFSQNKKHCSDQHTVVGDKHTGNSSQQSRTFLRCTDSPDSRRCHWQLSPDFTNQVALQKVWAITGAFGQRYKLGQCSCFHPREKEFSEACYQHHSHMQALGSTTSPTSCILLCFPRRCRKTAVSKPVKKCQSNTIPYSSLYLWSVVTATTIPAVPCCLDLLAWCKCLAGFIFCCCFLFGGVAPLQQSHWECFKCKRFWLQLCCLLALPAEVPKSWHHAPITLDFFVCSKHSHVGLFSFTDLTNFYILFKFSFHLFQTQLRGLADYPPAPASSCSNLSFSCCPLYHFVNSSSADIKGPRFLSGFSDFTCDRSLQRQYLWFPLAGTLEQKTGKILTQNALLWISELWRNILEDTFL